MCILVIHMLSHSVPVLWEKIGRVAKWAKLAIPSHSVPPWWEKIGKATNQAKLAVPSHSEPLWWEKIEKIVNQLKLAILSCFSGKTLEMLQMWQNCCSKSI